MLMSRRIHREIIECREQGDESKAALDKEIERMTERRLVMETKVSMHIDWQIDENNEVTLSFLSLNPNSLLD